MLEKVTRWSTLWNAFVAVGVLAVVWCSGLFYYVCVNVVGIDWFIFDFLLNELVIESACQYPYNIADAFDMLYDDVRVTIKSE